MSHWLLIGVNRGTRNTYGLIKKGVGTGCYLADQINMAEKEIIKELVTGKKGLGMLRYIVLYFLCYLHGEPFL